MSIAGIRDVPIERLIDSLVSAGKIKHSTWHNDLNSIRSQARNALLRNLPGEVMDKLSTKLTQNMNILQDIDTNEADDSHEDWDEDSKNKTVGGHSSDSGDQHDQRRKINWKVDYFTLCDAIQDLEQFYISKGIEVRNLFGMVTHPSLNALFDVKHKYEENFIFIAEAASILLRSHKYELPAATKQVSSLQTEIKRHRDREMTLLSMVQSSTASLSKICLLFNFQLDEARSSIGRVAHGTPGSQRGMLFDASTIAKKINESFNNRQTVNAKIKDRLLDLKLIIRSDYIEYALDLHRTVHMKKYSAIQSLYAGTEEAQGAPFPGVPSAWGPAKSRELPRYEDLDTFKHMRSLREEWTLNMGGDIEVGIDQINNIQIVETPGISLDTCIKDADEEDMDTIDWDIAEMENGSDEKPADILDKHEKEAITNVRAFNNERVLYDLLTEVSALKTFLKFYNLERKQVSLCTSGRGPGSTSYISPAVLLSSIGSLKRASAGIQSKSDGFGETQESELFQKSCETAERLFKLIREIIELIHLSQSEMSKNLLTNNIKKAIQRIESFQFRARRSRDLANEAYQRLSHLRVRSRSLSTHLRNVKARLERSLTIIPVFLDSQTTGINIIGRFDFEDIPDPVQEEFQSTHLTKSPATADEAEVIDFNIIDEQQNDETVGKLHGSVPEKEDESPKDDQWEEEVIEW